MRNFNVVYSNYKCIHWTSQAVTRKFFSKDGLIMKGFLRDTQITMFYCFEKEFSNLTGEELQTEPAYLLRLEKNQD